MITVENVSIQESTVSVPDVVFSLGACLWYCADYSLPRAEEPALSRALQQLLMQMTQEDGGRRPSLEQIIQVGIV